MHAPYHEDKYVQLPSCIQLFVTPMDSSMPGLPVPHHFSEFVQVHVHWIGDAIQPSHPLLPYAPFAFSLSQNQGFFQRVGCWHQVAKVLALSFSVSPSNEYSGLISFRIDWFDLLAFQGTFRSLLQQHSLRHQFFGVLPSLWSSSHNCTWPLGRP